MYILGIETSCDDTGVAILEAANDKCRLLANVISSQIKIHAPFGGVVPSLASRAHAENLDICLKEALEVSKINLSKIDLIAVTIGPGLIPCLLIGVNGAKALSYALNKPIIGVNHLEGHIVANILHETGDSFLVGDLLSLENAFKIFSFPAICLIVSGGHTQLILARKIGDYEIIGETRDDAVGEAFDKVAKLLGLGYPGGPIIAKRAERGDDSAIDLPRPMLATKNLDFSFSGLKTAVLYEIKRSAEKLGDEKYINDICASFQRAAVDVLIRKTFDAIEKYRVNTIILSGGVAANDLLRLEMIQQAEKLGLFCFIPRKEFCADNAAMIALVGYFNKEGAGSWRDISANANLRLESRK